MVQCCCLTTTGKRCSREAKKDSLFCYQHMDCTENACGELSEKETKQKTADSTIENKFIDSAAYGRLKDFDDYISQYKFTENGLSNALNVAAINGHLEIVNKLLKIGVDPEGVWKFLKEIKSVEILKRLKDTSKGIKAYEGAIDKQIEKLEKLEKLEKPVNIPTSKQNMKLMDSAADGQLEDVEKLLSQYTFNKNTLFNALHGGAINGHIEVVNKLLDSGAEPHEIHFNDVGSVEVLKRLKQALKGNKEYENYIDEHIEKLEKLEKPKKNLNSSSKKELDDLFSEALDKIRKLNVLKHKYVELKENAKKIVLSTQAHLNIIEPSTTEKLNELETKLEKATLSSYKKQLTNMIANIKKDITERPELEKKLSYWSNLSQTKEMRELLENATEKRNELIKLIDKINDYNLPKSLVTQISSQSVPSIDSLLESDTQLSDLENTMTILRLTINKL